jgi:hypothetical protein
MQRQNFLTKRKPGRPKTVSVARQYIPLSSLSVEGFEQKKRQCIDDLTFDDEDVDDNDYNGGEEGNDSNIAESGNDDESSYASDVSEVSVDSNAVITFPMTPSKTQASSASSSLPSSNRFVAKLFVQTRANKKSAATPAALFSTAVDDAQNAMDT